MSRANARDEWRAAQLVTDSVLETAPTSLACAAARHNHAVAEGVTYA
jgi:hypothetical protein